MQRCPVCRARIDAQIQCSRCGTDLSILIHIAKLAKKWEAYTVQQLAAGDLDQARQAIKQVLKLRQGPLARALAGFIRQQNLQS